MTHRDQAAGLCWGSDATKTIENFLYEHHIQALYLDGRLSRE